MNSLHVQEADCSVHADVIGEAPDAKLLIPFPF